MNQDLATPVWCWVYFLLAPKAGLVKIGVTSNLSARLKALQYGSPELLEPLCAVLGSREDEERIHIKIRALRHHGEWFYYTPEVAAEIQRIYDKNDNAVGKAQNAPWLRPIVREVFNKRSMQRADV